jgi:hypothetical protein
MVVYLRFGMMEQGGPGLEERECRLLELPVSLWHVGRIEAPELVREVIDGMGVINFLIS